MKLTQYIVEIYDRTTDKSVRQIDTFDNYYDASVCRDQATCENECYIGILRIEYDEWDDEILTRMD